MVAPLSQQHQSREDSDRRLLQKVAAGDREAFRELYVVYHRRLARFLVRLTRRYEVAEEIINDTLWVVWRKAGEFRGDSRISTWIMGIAYRRALKTLRCSNCPSNSAWRWNMPTGTGIPARRSPRLWIARPTPLRHACSTLAPSCARCCPNSPAWSPEP